jgi:hypothetical protein
LTSAFLIPDDGQIRDLRDPDCNRPSAEHFRIYLCVFNYVSNFSVVLHWCETWSLTLREEHRLRVFENRVLRRIFGPRRDEMTGDWRKLHNEELHNFYSSSNIIRMKKSRRMRRARNVARMGRRGMHIGYWWESQKERDQ